MVMVSVLEGRRTVTGRACPRRQCLLPPARRRRLLPPRPAHQSEAAGAARDAICFWRTGTAAVQTGASIHMDALLLEVCYRLILLDHDCTLRAVYKSFKLCRMSSA